jgi:hypothetical protein
MRTNNFHHQFANQPLRLNEEEKQNPYLVLDDFYSFFHLQDIREILWEWLVAAMSTDCGKYSTGYDRSNLIFVYEKLELLLEATSSIHKRRRKFRKRNLRKWKGKA